MILTQQEAAASSGAIAATEQRVRQLVQYDVSSRILIVWGLLWATGYGFEYLQAAPAGFVWLVVDAIGLLGTAVVVFLKKMRGTVDVRDGRLAVAFVSLLACGVIWSVLPGSINQRQMDPFWPTLVMSAYILGGFWRGRSFIVLGISLTALILIGYFALGAWFELWMTIVGGGLILGELWLRRRGEPGAEIQ